MAAMSTWEAWAATKGAKSASRGRAVLKLSISFGCSFYAKGQVSAGTQVRVDTEPSRARWGW